MDPSAELPPPLPADIPATAPRRPTWPVWIAWAVILASVATTMWKTQEDKSAPIEADGKVSRLFEMEGRYAVGILRSVAQFGPFDPGGTGRAQIKAEILHGDHTSAKTPADRLRLAIVEAHLDTQTISEGALTEAATHGEKLEKDVEILQRLNESPENAMEVLETEDWKRFAARHGWFADLAASDALPTSDPRHDAPLRAAERTAVAMISAAILGVGAIGLGFLLLVSAIILQALGRLPRTSRPVPAGASAVHSGVFVEAFALYLGGWVGAGMLLSSAGFDRFGLVRILIPIGFVILAFFWPLIRGTGVGTWRESLGLHRGAGFWREVGWGVLGYLAGLPLLVLGALVTYKLMQWGHTDATHPIVDWFDGRLSVIALLALLAVVWAPITEEIMFRGALFAGLQRRLPWWSAALIVAVIFAAIHPQGWAGIPALAAIAMTLATLRHYRGSLIASITAHALNNGVALTVMTFMMG